MEIASIVGSLQGFTAIAVAILIGFDAMGTAIGLVC